MVYREILMIIANRHCNKISAYAPQHGRNNIMTFVIIYIIRGGQHEYVHEPLSRIDKYNDIKRQNVYKSIL